MAWRVYVPGSRHLILIATTLSCWFLRMRYLLWIQPLSPTLPPQSSGQIGRFFAFATRP